jgi:dTDP-4-amino-4,6-dideoxygalactose transaminase
MRDTFLAFSPPCIGEEEIAEVADTLRSGWITTGPKVADFEKRFAEFVGAPSALALSSGTSALHLALVASGVGPGDAVVTSPMTFCSTVHVIEHVGARPILVDVEPETLNIDPAGVEEALESSARRGWGDIKAIIPVHLYGHPCKMDRLLQLAEQHGHALVDDAAHALPASYRGRVIGTLGTLTAFSFYATKNLTTAEGGMLTGDRRHLEEARIWSLHGMSRDAWHRRSGASAWRYDVIRCGFKYNMTDIQAAIGIHQLRRLPQSHARRQQIARRYHQALSQCQELSLPREAPEVKHAWHLYVIRLNLEALSLSRDRFIEELAARNIGTSVHFVPVHVQPYYRDKYGYEPNDFPVTNREWKRLVSLPLYPNMTDQDVDDVIEAVNDVVRRTRR